MRITKHNWWTVLTEPIVGFEPGEGAGAAAGTGEGASAQGAGEGEGANGAGEGAGEGQGSQGTGTEGEGASEDVSGLKSALEKERNDKKALDKELKAFRKKEEERLAAEKTEIERATDTATKESARVAKLSAGFRRNAVNSAVLEAARAAKFLDPSDALRPEVLDAIGVEQDEDDPSNVTIDRASVVKAVKALAASKKHYVGAEVKVTPKSGSQFGGSGTGNMTADEKALAEKYPALRGRI